MPQRDWLALYLEEDLGPDGDITSDSLFASDLAGAARVVAREHLFLAGTRHCAELFHRTGCTTKPHMNDGSWVDQNAVVLTVEGPVRGILAAERTALNLLGRMSGIATETRRLTQRLAKECAGTRVAATRKTTPGFRRFEKEAIAIGGGDPHRAGLWDEAMIKDNHIAAAGDVATAVRRVKQAHPDKVLTVEVETLQAAMDASAAGADWLMIDNQDPETGRAWAEAVWKEHPDIKIEASGGITEERITDYGWADRISLGALTTRARSVDFGLDWGVDPGLGSESGPAPGRGAR